MPTMTLRFRAQRRSWRLTGSVEASGDAAAAWFEAHAGDPGTRVLLRGFPDYAMRVLDADAVAVAALRSRVGGSVQVASVRRRLDQVVSAAPADERPTALLPDLFLLADGRFATRADATPDTAALVTAARWVSTRRTVAFERLFPKDAFHPEVAERLDRLSPVEGEAMRTWLVSRLPSAPPQERSAIATLLSHLVATGPRDPAFAAVSSAAADQLVQLADTETVPALRAHLVGLLQLRGPALSAAQQDAARRLLAGLNRVAPPYAELGPVWNFAMVSAWDFHAGEVASLQRAHGFTEVVPNEGRPGYTRYLEAPFTGKEGQKIRIWARSGSPGDETREMGDPFFVGLLIHRHAQLGSFDLRAAALATPQVGYKLFVNTQCAGLTTRFAIARCYPDADLYTSWDSTYFRTDPSTGQLSASEGLDCFIAILKGMAAGEDHAAFTTRIRRAQWHHAAAADPSFVQFVGPGHPAVVARYEDVNQDGKADLYDGFCDLELRTIAEDVGASATPRSPGVAASGISGEAATGLGWAVGSLNRVAQYSDLWEGLLGRSELYYPFVSAGFHDGAPVDLPAGPTGERPEALPAMCRLLPSGPTLRAEVSLHAHFAHSGKEIKRLFVAAGAFWACIDGGALVLPRGLDTVAHQRGALLLTLAGLLEFPADQNQLDALWSAALRRLRLPEISRSTVRAHINDADHDASNYYGSRRGLPELVAALAADPVVRAALESADPKVGRPAPVTP